VSPTERRFEFVAAGMETLALLQAWSDEDSDGCGSCRRARIDLSSTDRYGSFRQKVLSEPHTTAGGRLDDRLHPTV